MKRKRDEESQVRLVRAVCSVTNRKLKLPEAAESRLSVAFAVTRQGS